jgi:AcrR family transcriptional regulator
MQKRVRASIDRRQQILEAALDVFDEKGFELATTKEIAVRVGIAQGLVYFYFANKATLLMETCKHQLTIVLNQINAQKYTMLDTISEETVRKALGGIVYTIDEPRTMKLVRIMVRHERPESNAQHPQNEQPDKLMFALMQSLMNKLSELLERSLPNYPDQEELLLQAEFFAVTIISYLVRRSLQEEQANRISPSQLTDLFTEHVMAWIFFKKAMLSSEEK